MSASFKDCFSQVAKGYTTFRPTYPDRLFAWLASIAPGSALAWDCACGSGQATLQLADYFDHVHATDASGPQIASAPAHPRIARHQAPAHNSGLADSCVDLVTVAQALHWFDLPAFYAEVQRVLRPNGIFAVWTYGMNTVEGEAVNRIAIDFYENVVGGYWPPERKLVETGYRSLPFPFEELATPVFTMEAHWTIDQLLGYYRTWSATSRYIADNHTDPVTQLEERLAPKWLPRGEKRKILWPLAIRAGRKNPVL